MGDTSKWLRILRNQRKESQIELNQVRLEYEAQLLVVKKQNDWLSEKLIETQRQLRLLTYDIEKKEGMISALQADLRGTEKFRRSAPKEETVTSGVASEAGMGSGDFIKHDIPV